jgi:hypothetical protein
LQVLVVLPPLIFGLNELLSPLPDVLLCLLYVLLGLLELLPLHFDLQVHVLGDLHHPVHQARQLLELPLPVFEGLLYLVQMCSLSVVKLCSNRVSAL